MESPTTQAMAGHTKETALVATLQKHREARFLLFCCPEEISFYKHISESHGFPATTNVLEFKKTPSIAMMLLPHSDDAGKVFLCICR
jgi:hypothetical protein